MNKSFLFLFSTLVLTSLTANATTHKGQKEFAKKCVICHEAGQAFIATKKKATWNKLMKDKGKKLADIHVSSSKANGATKYFKDRKYKKKARDLKEFFIQ